MAYPVINTIFINPDIYTTVGFVSRFKKGNTTIFTQTKIIVR